MKSWKLILGLFVILLFVSACAPQRTVNTSGEAIIEVEPDLASVYFSITTLEESAEESKDGNSKTLDKVYAALYKIGIDRDEIETENFNIYEEYDWKDGERKSKGFRTNHQMKVSTEEFDDVGEIVDAVIDAGNDNVRINFINFELSDDKEKEFKKQALTMASEDAREKAESIASGLGARLGNLVSVSDSGYYYNPYPLYRAETGAMDVMAVKEAVNTEISPKDLEIRANVQVVYQIK